MSSISINDPRHAANGKEFMGHPAGLYILFLVELWERFSYYGMRALLTLFLAAPLLDINPGFGWDKSSTYAFYGWYTMLVYLASIPGGILADKFIGQKKAVMIGGLLLCAGHLILAVNAPWAFFLGIALIVLGVGGLKANISTMVGGLYKQGDDRRDKGFYLFYIGINVGGFLGPLLAGWMAYKYGWHWGFGLAGIGMILGQIVFMWGQKFLVGVGDVPIKSSKENHQEGDASLGELFSNLLKSKVQLMITLALSLVSVFMAYSYASGIETHAFAALGIFLSLVIGLMMMIYRDVDAIEKDRFVVLLLSFLIVIVFWGAFEQAGGLMNLYAKTNTNRMIDWLNFEVPAAWFQSINSFFIITLGTSIAAFWVWWKNRGNEYSSIYKMAIGVIIMGLGFSFMAIASVEFTNNGSSAMIWLVLAYLFHTIGELCASPVALSFITKVAPIKYVSIMMGVYFAATGLGNKVAGLVGEFSVKAGELEIFIGLIVFTAVFGGLVLLLLKPLKRLTHGAEDAQLEA
ncbi:MAG: peptide MFS transporter [Cyclobacteriaceae bacterium]|nr:peptide MFS transporter [Cyclobacteriaceae bacterium]